MKWLKYTHRTVVTETDFEGNAVEREVYTEMAVPDNENGRALAEKEAYDGIIEEYDDGEPEADGSGSMDMAAEIDALKKSNAELQEALDLLLSGATEEVGSDA